MTYLKRFLFHLFMLVVGGGLSLLVLHLVEKKTVVPPAFSWLLMAMFMALCLGLGFLLVDRIIPLSAEAAVIPGARRQSWAWLRPKGDRLKSGFPLNKDHLIIGREVQCAIMLNDNSVSRQHSSITRLAEGYLLKDLGSSNGTYVNGQRVQEYLLQDGDRVSIGDMEFWFEAPIQEKPPALGMSNQGRAIIDTTLPQTTTGGGFSLDPSQGMSFGADDDEEDGTEAWHPRPDDLKGN